MEKKKCPICNTEMESQEWNGVHGLEESYNNCTNGCKLYSDEYAYGNTRITVGEEEWGYSYRDTKEYQQQVSREVNEAIEKVKIK